MDETNNDQLIRSKVGLAGESFIFGIVLMLTTFTVLYINDNSVQYSLLAGIILGAVFSTLRIVIQRYRS